MSNKNQIENWKKIISNYEYVSFDIFDTLIKRNLPKPSSLFLIVQEKYERKYNRELQDWKSIRIEAEIKAREKSNEEEITLDDIYANINSKIENLEELKKIEVETEIELCEKNMQLYELYKFCKEQQKKIIITSDMYLDEEVIKTILQKNEFMYDMLFLSSELKKTKRTGSLFKYILENLKITNKQIVHIGDNKKSDYISAKKIGIYAILIQEENRLSYYNEKDVDSKDKFNYECLKAFINHHIDKTKGYYWKCGYETFGPLLYGYIKWLDEQFKNNNYTQIYFLARDGYIMQRAYDIIYPDNKTRYIYASRRALLVPTIWMYKDLNEIFQNMLLPKEITVRAFLKKMGLDAEKYQKVIEKYGYTLEQKISLKTLKDEKIEFYEEIKNDIYENSKKEYDNLLKYFNFVEFKGKVAIVDIGWYGNMQKALENTKKIANWNVDIDGYYVGIVPDSDKQLIYNMKGYLFEKGREELFIKKKFFNAIFELIFLAHHGSVKKYTEDTEKVELYPYEYENIDTDNNMQEFQKGALQFINDYLKSGISNYIEYNENIAMYNLLELGNRPRKIDIKSFGNIEFYDDDYCKINQAKSLLYYLFHPKQFKHDLDVSKWKTGFLKSILKINIPYFEILKKVRERVKNTKK